MDGDSIPDKDDRCPESAGSKENDGCPEQSAPIFENIGELILPPPRPTQFRIIERSFFDNNIRYMAEIDYVIKNSLHKNGYFQNKYLLVENGFALMTQIEQIDKNGFSVPEENRWINDIWQPKEFSIRDFFKLLFSAQPGYYRSFIFVVTNNLYKHNGDATKKGIEETFNEGVQVLPNEIANQRFTMLHNVEILVYEFIKSEFGGNVSFIRKSPRNHVKNSKILDSLEIK